MTTLEELVETLTRAGAGKAQIEQETRNWNLAQEVMKKPRHERATPFCALDSARKRSRNAEAVAYYQTDPAVRAVAPPEPTESDLRKAISQEHRKLSKEGGDPSKLTELLKKKRAK